VIARNRMHIEFAFRYLTVSHFIAHSKPYPSECLGSCCTLKFSNQVMLTPSLSRKCESCTKFGFDCEYAPGILAGSSRSDAKSSRVRQLEDRLGRVEHLLHSKNKRDAVTAPSTNGKDAVVESDKDETSLDPDAIRIL
jgi:hypothetical protein